jgi:hypothetical protein
VKDLSDIYLEFETIYANSRMIRSPEELDAAIRAAEASYEDVNEDWLRALDRAWVYGDTDVPFADDRSNQRYRMHLETS